MTQRQSHLLWLALLLLLAVFFRLDWTFSWATHALFHSPAIDEALHWQWAQQLAQGHLPELPWFRAPLFPIFLAGLHKLGLGLTGLRFTGVALSLLLLILMGKWAQYEGGPRAQLWLICLGALQGGLVYFAPMLLIPQLMLTLLAGASLAFSYSRRSESLFSLALGGLLLGLAAISRPTVAPLILAAFAFLWKPESKSEMTVKGRGSKVLITTLLFLLPMVPLAMQNGWPGSGVLLASQGGVNFWIGNNPQADGLSASLPGSGVAWERWDTQNEAAQNGIHGAGAESLWYYHKGLDWILSHPAEAGALALRKASLLLESQPLNNNTAIAAMVADRPSLALSLNWAWPVLLFLGLGGLIEGFPKSLSSRRWILAVLVIQALLLVAFFVNSRFRQVFIPFLLLPAGCWLAALDQRRSFLSPAILLQAFSAVLAAWLFAQPMLLVLPMLAFRLFWADFPSKWKREGVLHGLSWSLIALAGLGEIDAIYAALPGGLLALGYLFAQKEHKHLRILVMLALFLVLQEANPFTLSRSEKRFTHNRARLAFQEGNAWLRLNDTAKARQQLQRAIALEPGLREARLNLGILDQQAGNLQQAMQWYTEELSINPRSAKALNNLGGLYLHTGQEDAAIGRFRQALSLRPGLEDARWNLGMALSLRGLQELDKGDSSAASSFLQMADSTSYRGKSMEDLLMRLGYNKSIP